MTYDESRDTVDQGHCSDHSLPSPPTSSDSSALEKVKLKLETHLNGKEVVVSKSDEVF